MTAPQISAPLPALGRDRTSTVAATYPTAAEARWPYPGRTVAEVDAPTSHIAETAARIFLTHDPRPLKFVAPVAPDRSPCPRCGCRADIGCSHRRL
jgi:hypothetical protein